MRQGENRMSRIIQKCLPAAILLVFCVPGVSASGPPDQTLFTTYNIDASHTSLSWVVCGSTQQSSGCYAAGSLGPFGKIGALLEGNQSTNLTTNTVTRAIYVLDVATGGNLNGVKLYVYKKTDTVTATFDTVSVSLSKTISLPLVGGSSALASMAANTKFLFIGTNQSPSAVEIQKGTFTMTQIGGFSPPIDVSAITSDKYGYVTVTFGSFGGGESGFVVLGPDGAGREDGGGAPFMLNTDQAVLPSTLP
jgi:hypothetical protein